MGVDDFLKTTGELDHEHFLNVSSRKLPHGEEKEENTIDKNFHVPSKRQVMNTPTTTIFH